MRDDISDGAWTFYDSWAAFPSSPRDDEGGRVIGEFMVGLDAPDGGTYGEFAIRFYDFNHSEPLRRGNDIAARLEAFGDSWQALGSNTELVAALAEMAEGPQGPDDVRAMLLRLGFEDRTRDLRGDRPAICATCRGTGVLDDVAPIAPR